MKHLIEDLISAMEYHVEQTRPIHSTTVALQAAREALKPPPAQRPWVGLTDEAIWLEYQKFWSFHPAEEPTLAKDIVKFARAIESKLKEKNA